MSAKRRPRRSQTKPNRREVKRLRVPSARARGRANQASRGAIGLTIGASTSLASTGSVYFDSSDNVGAGHDFFNGTFSGLGNVGLSYSVMPNLTTGDGNVATGYGVLYANTTGDGNVAPAPSPLNNTTGDDNVATGFEALYANTSGDDNVASGETRSPTTPPAPSTSRAAPRRSPSTPPASLTPRTAIARFGPTRAA